MVQMCLSDLEYAEVFWGRCHLSGHARHDLVAIHMRGDMLIQNTLLAPLLRACIRHVTLSLRRHSGAIGRAMGPSRIPNLPPAPQ